MCVVLHLLLKAEFCRAVRLDSRVEKEWKRGRPGTHFCLSLFPRLDLTLPWPQVWELEKREFSCFSLPTKWASRLGMRGGCCEDLLPSLWKEWLLLPFYLPTLIWKISLALPYLEPCEEENLEKCAPVKLCGHKDRWRLSSYLMYFFLTILTLSFLLWLYFLW